MWPQPDPRERDQDRTVRKCSCLRDDWKGGEKDPERVVSSHGRQEPRGAAGRTGRCQASVEPVQEFRSRR